MRTTRPAPRALAPRRAPTRHPHTRAASKPQKSGIGDELLDFALVSGKDGFF